MLFKIDESQYKKLDDWTKIQDKKAEALWKGSGPVGGAIGGCYTYCFTPTGLGLITVVKNCITKEEINLTNFEDW